MNACGHLLESLQTEIAPIRQTLLAHPLYRDLRGAAAMRVFMEHHIFAVWDFMSLLKSLQQRLCCVTVPWLPAKHPSASRLINEIVLGEESDDDGRGGHASHFELYLRAMTEFGADTTGIDRFLSALRIGCDVSAALSAAGVDQPVRGFVQHTFSLIAEGDVCQIAAAFTYGREDLLPDVFQRIVHQLHQESGGTLETFEFYLRRHIELDAGEHGPMASQLVASLCGDDPSNWRRATRAAVAALQARLEFWDGIHAAILRDGGVRS